MFYIDSVLMEPDIEYMKSRIQENLDRGIAVYDVSDLYKEILKSQEAAALNLRSVYGIANPNSSQQLQNFILNNLDSRIEQVCIVNDKVTTKKEALQELAREGYQFAIDLLTYRKVKKYAEALKSILDYTEDGVVRPIMSLGKTNRVNYKEPALMNIPKKLLWNVIAPRKPGNILISVDIKNQEPWILINMLGIEELKEKLSASSKEGLYDIVFKELYGREASDLERSQFKTCWNALTYGATKASILARGKIFDAEKLYNYFNSFDEFKEYRNKCYAMAKRKMQRVETYFGTELYANQLGAALQRVLMDLPIQGTGSDILALLIQHADEELVDRELDDVIEFYFSRHDEIIFEVDGEYANRVGLDTVYAELRDIMEHQVDDWEPFKVEIKKVEPAPIINYTEDEEEEDEE